jgi:hypothetical protein
MMGLPNVPKGGSHSCRLIYPQPHLRAAPFSPPLFVSHLRPVRIPKDIPMLMNYSHIDAEAARAEELIPSLSYAALLDNLVWLTKLGVLAPGNPASMLVVARLVDRARIRRSGITAEQLRASLDAYRGSANPVYAVVKALEQAIASL